MLQIEDKDFEHIKQVVIDYIGEAYPDRHFTFKVDSRRADKNYPVHSEEMNRPVGRGNFKRLSGNLCRCA